MGDWPKSKPVVPAAPVPPPLVPAPVVTNPPGTNGSSELSPGLQDVLAKELVKIGPHKIQLVVVGTNIHARNLFDQLRDVFAKSKWEVNAVLIGQASIIGMNFPDSSYITGSDIASPLIDRVFTTFAQKIGIKLLLTPNGFDATSGQRAEIAIVLR
jgi:hypothetical protein